MTRLMFEVLGDPVTEGSTRAFVSKDGKARVVHDSPHLDGWRQAIGYEAKKHVSGPLHEGRVDVTAVFWLLRPKSVSVKKRPSPTVIPDVDKLTRALLDALSGIVYRDDGQVCRIEVEKRYCDAGQPRPGVAVTVVLRD